MQSLLEYAAAAEHSVVSSACLENLPPYDRAFFSFVEPGQELQQRYCCALSGGGAVALAPQPTAAAAPGSVMCGGLAADLRGGHCLSLGSGCGGAGGGGGGGYAYVGVKAMPLLGGGSVGCHSGTPHGISDILGRRPDASGLPIAGTRGEHCAQQQQQQQQQQLHFAGVATSTATSVTASCGFGALQQLGPTTATATSVKHPPPYYWPGMMMGQDIHFNAYDWQRAADGPRSLSPDSAEPRETSKKKNSRPTFSGHQIFSLEKTFEQTRYLAGQERARLARSLGMTEGQVKVWFQNRRTKWRKKTPTEAAMAKRKSDKKQEATTTEPQLGAAGVPKSGDHF